jgi:hypothetical protein
MGARLEDDEEESTDVGLPLPAIVPCVACAGMGSVLTLFGSKVTRRDCVVCRGSGGHLARVAEPRARRQAP